MSASWEEAYKSIEPSAKSKEIASEKFFGKEIFTPEQVEAQRHKIGIGLKGIASGLLGSFGDLSEFAQGIVGVKKPLKILPSSEDVGQFFEKMSGEKFTPETTGEKFIEKSASGLGSILGLGGPIKAGPKIGSLARTALAAFVPAAVATATEKENLPEWAQAASTIGSSFLLHRITGKGLKEMEKGLYSEAKRLLPEGAEAPARNLRSNLESLKIDLKKGLEAPSESAVIKSIDKLKSKIQGHKIDVDKLTASRRSLNELTMVDEVRKSPRARKLLKGVIKDIDQSINEYGKENPEYLKVYRQANSLHRGMQEAKSIESFIQRNPYLASAGGAFLAYLSPFTLGTTAALGKTGAFASALARNPGFRKAYWDVLKNASKEEGRGTLSALKKFNQEAEKAQIVQTESSWEEAFNNIQNQN